MQVDLLVTHASQLLTLSAPAPRRGAGLSSLGIIRDGAVAVRSGRVVAVGPTGSMQRLHQPLKQLDAAGRVVMPAFVDPHTHVLYAGDRIDEFELRLQGAGYQEIMNAGGGIMNTVCATRSASDAAILQQTRARLARMLSQGTATAEVKTGYGLDPETELRMLHLIHELGQSQPMRLVPTFLGAHAVPAEYSGRADDYVALVVEEMLPHAAGLAVYCDVFCDEGAFTLAQTARILRRARGLGLGVKVHADEFAALGAAPLAVELHAASADHLVVTPETERRSLAASGVAAVLLPATGFGLGGRHYAPARAWVDTGAVVALATDCNPGTAPCESMPFVVALACRRMGLAPAEAIVAATLNAAYAIGMDKQVGSLVPGKCADLLILEADDYRELAYRFASPLVHTVIVKGLVHHG